MTFDNTSFTYSEQYIWYQFLYQGGVFLSRTSIFFFRIRWVLPMGLLQLVNLVFLCLETYFHFIPSIYIVFVIIFYEGLLGGLIYANTVYRISQKMDDKQREFAMVIIGLGDSTGISLAAIVAIFLNQALCRHRGNCKRS
jgi:battenin